MLNDYIRRSDVLKLFDEWGGGFAYIEVETDGAIKDVNNLPSIGHCQDCEFYNSMFCTMVECFDNGTAPFDFCSYFKERDGEPLPPL